MDTPLTQRTTPPRRVRRRGFSSGSPPAPSHGDSDDVQEMSSNSTEVVSGSDCHIQTSSESSDDYGNRSSGRRRKRRKTSVTSFASEQSGDDTSFVCESLESDNGGITPGHGYVLPQRCDLTDSEKKRVDALLQEIKVEVTVFVAVMLRSYNSYVTIPKEYAVVHFPHESAIITLQSPGKKKKWCPRFYKKGTMIKLTGSWAHFVRDNDVHVGDICIFVPGNGGNTFTFTVHLLRKETTDSQTEVSHESPECKDPHGQPPYILPYGTRLSPSQRNAVGKKVDSIQSEVQIYVSIMTKSNLGSRHMELSKRYAAEHLPRRNVTLMFHCMGKTWNINMLFHDRKSPERWYLIGGWSKFISDNSLRLGDICLFELKRNEEELTMIVHLLRKESIDHPPGGGSSVLDSNYVRANTKIASTVHVREEPADEEETSSSGREEQAFDDEPIEHNHSDGTSKAHMPTDPCSESNASEISPSSEAREEAVGSSNKSFAPELPSNPSPTIHTEQDSSSGDHRRVEHVEGESDVALQSLLRVTGQQLGDAEKEVNARDGDNTLADPSHVEPQNVAVVPSQTALPMPKEIEAQSNRSAQPNVAQAQPPQGKVEQAGLYGVASSQPLQPEMQASTSSEVEAQANVVIQSAQPSVAPAQLAQGETEQDLSGVAPPSQPETGPSISGVVEAQSNLVTQSVQQNKTQSDAASAQPLVPEMQPSTPLSNIPLERTHPSRSQSSHQLEAAPGSAQPAQLFPVPSMMFNHPPIGDEPLKNELHWLQLHIDSLNKINELKRSQLQIECSQEIEKIKQKYDLLLEEGDSVHLEQRKTLDGLCEKVVFHQSLANDFRAKFISSSAGQAKAHNPPMHQTRQRQASQQAPTGPSLVGVTSTSPPVAMSSAGRPIVPRDAQPPHVGRPSTSASLQAPRPPLPSPQVVRPPLMPGNLVRSTGAPSSHTPRIPQPRSHGVPCAPPPHLQRRLPPRAHSPAPANQQQQHATPARNAERSLPPRADPMPPANQQQHATPARNAERSLPPRADSTAPVNQQQHATPARIAERSLPPRAHSTAPANQQQHAMDVDVVCLSDDD